MEKVSQHDCLRFGANLSERGQNIRLRMSVIALAVALITNVVLFRYDMAPVWRLLTFVPFFLSASGAMQGLLRTCPMHSREGTRETDTGSALPLPDERSRRASRRLGSQIWLFSLGIAGAATGLVYALP